MDCENEIWIDLVGFESLYMISNFGRIASLKRVTRNNIKINYKIKSTSILNSGYEKVSLNKNGKQYNKTIHRLVIMSFKGIDKNKKYVNHIDGNKLNNNLSNLEWCTQSSNLKHSYKIGTHKKLMTGKHGRYHPRSLPIYMISIENDLIIREFESARDAQVFTGTDNSDILKVCRGKRPTAGGYKWKFKNN